MCRTTLSLPATRRGSSGSWFIPKGSPAPGTTDVLAVYGRLTGMVPAAVLTWIPVVLLLDRGSTVGRQPTRSSAWSQNNLVFVGAFAVVTYLELLGTGLGTWTWQVRDPVLGVVAMGNPPSGAAGGYGFFDAAALWLAPRLIESIRLSVAGRMPGKRQRRQPVDALHRPELGWSVES